MITDRNRWLLVPLGVFLLTRLAIFGVGVVGTTMFPVTENHWVAEPVSQFLSTWAKWDSQYYVDIAVNGYWYRPGQMSNVAFFPVYPFMMRLLSPLVGGSVVLAGFLISNLAYGGALVFLYLLTELELGPDAARRTVIYLSIFPTTFFFNAVYTESLFMCLTVASMYFARKRQWGLAALLGMISAATRNLGVLLWGLVMWEWLRSQGWSLKTILSSESWRSLRQGVWLHWFDLLVIAMIPLGLAAYMLFLSQNFERPLAFIEAQSAWGRENIGPIQVLQKNFAILAGGQINKSWLTTAWNLSAFLLFVGLVPFIWRDLGEGYALYVLIMLLVPTSSALGSLIRYVLTAFPAFMQLGLWGRRESLDRLLSLVFAILAGLFTTIFVSWIFVA